MRRFFEDGKKKFGTTYVTYTDSTLAIKQDLVIGTYNIFLFYVIFTADVALD